MKAEWIRRIWGTEVPEAATKAPDLTHGPDEVPFPLVKFFFCGCLAIAAVLIHQTFTVFMMSVEPAIVGLILQGAGVVTAIVGCRVIIDARGSPSRWFVYLSGILAALGCVIGRADLFDVSAAPPAQRLVVGAVTIVVAAAGCWVAGVLCSRLRRVWRYAIGLIVIVVAVIAPAIVLGRFLVDRL